jgi:hypothetical protein
MSNDGPGASSSLRHGAVQLPAIAVDTYNADLRDAERFVGDRASRRAFAALVEDWRERLRKLGQEDPLGDIPAEELKKKKLDKILLEGEPEAAALVHSATEDFAQELSSVIRSWRSESSSARCGAEPKALPAHLGGASSLSEGLGSAIEFWPSSADGFWPTPGPSTYGRLSRSGDLGWTGEPKWICSSSFEGEGGYFRRNHLVPVPRVADLVENNNANGWKTKFACLV